jgi:ABC-type branched-subunit amino acid transport system ATPase component
MTTPVALEIRDVVVSFGGLRAVDVEHMAVHRGRIVGLIGPNGAGKTTLFDAVSGFVAQRSGSIVLDGRWELSGLPPVQRARLGLGRSFQAATLFESLTVADALMVAFHARLEGSGPLSSALHLPGAWRAERAMRKRVDELIEMMGLGAFHDKFISELSTGTRRIVDLAGVLAVQPSVLLLDEPSSGIAQREVEVLAGLLREVREAIDCTMVVVEHDIPLVRDLCDELYAMETGRVIAHGTCEEVLSDDAVVESYLGGGTRAVERSGARPRPAAAAAVGGRA